MLICSWSLFCDRAFRPPLVCTVRRPMAGGAGVGGQALVSTGPPQELPHLECCTIGIICSQPQPRHCRRGKSTTAAATGANAVAAAAAARNGSMHANAPGGVATTVGHAVGVYVLRKLSSTSTRDGKQSRCARGEDQGCFCGPCKTPCGLLLGITVLGIAVGAV